MLVREPVQALDSQNVLYSSTQVTKKMDFKKREMYFNVISNVIENSHNRALGSLITYDNMTFSRLSIELADHFYHVF